MKRTPENLIDFTCSALGGVRAQAPLIQCLTNSVVVNVTANTLLALGASAAMVDILAEAGPFAAVASGLLVNLGTPNAEQREAILEAVPAANEAHTPWVLDPVAIGSLPVRTPLGHTLRDLRPSVVRGNASEIIALTGSGAGGRGVDTSEGVDAAAPFVSSLTQTGAVVAISGPVDFITDGHQTVRIANGDALLTKITGGGCALGAAIAAFVAVDEDRLASTVAANIVYTVAAQLAAERSSGPGSFGAQFLDALYLLDADTIRRRAAVTVALG